MDNQVCEAIWFSVVFIVISSSIRRGYWFAYNKQSQDLQHNINLLSDGPPKISIRIRKCNLTLQNFQELKGLIGQQPFYVTEASDPKTEANLVASFMLCREAS